MSTRDSSSRGPASLSRDKPLPAAEAYYLAFERLAGRTLSREPGLDQSIRIASLGEGQTLLVAGTVDSRIHVVLEGFLTLTYVSPDGISWVKGFVPPHLPFACVSCLDGMPAPFSASAGSSCKVASAPFPALDRVARDCVHWQRAISNAFKLYGQRKEKREMELLTRSAEERYTGFLQEMPEIARQLKQHEIASYVRVTPVSLSRIRRRLGLTPAGNSRHR